MNHKRRAFSSESEPRRAVPPHLERSPGSRSAQPNRPVAERIRGILATRNLTLYDVSRQTLALFPENPHYHIPHNFYFQIDSAGLSPTLHQMSALSLLTRYRFGDWLAVFGFSLDEIPRLEAALPSRRTAFLDNKVYDVGAKTSWFRERPHEAALPPFGPLSRLLEPAGPRRLSLLMEMNRKDFLYATIGWEDAFAFPELLPGSIVRANPQSVERLLPKPNGQITKHLFLVEHTKGLCCCRLHLASKNRVTLIAPQLPFAQVELQLGSESRILGTLDLEFRRMTSLRPPSMASSAPPEVAPDLAKLWKPGLLGTRTLRERPSVLLRNARHRAHLSFRNASAMSRQIATALHDEKYFTAPGSLSDYEASDRPPRHVHKIFTLCILYSLGFSELVKSFGLTFSESGLEPIPDEWLARGGPPDGEDREAPVEGETDASGFFSIFLNQFGEIPFFLRNSLDSLSGLTEVSLRDVFWVSGRPQPLHPSVDGVLFAVVNRRRKKPVTFRQKPVWEQPLYLLMKRDGSYFPASCSLENGLLVIHPHSEGFIQPELLRNAVDAEVVGQIVAVVRSLVPRNE